MADFVFSIKFHFKTEDNRQVYSHEFCNNLQHGCNMYLRVKRITHTRSLNSSQSTFEKCSHHQHAMSETHTQPRVDRLTE